jgi:hypothetical protein
MKLKTLTIILLVTVSVAACAPLAQPTPTQVIEAPPTTVSNTDEAEVRNLVESFGKKLQLISLLAPNAAGELQNQYVEFVSPALLETWMNDISKAPGREVSSPWPDRIEITTLESVSPDRYVIDGFVIEITSTEINSDEAANQIPVHIAVERKQGHWWITEYVEEH